jgi:hypothetical protein
MVVKRDAEALPTLTVSNTMSSLPLPVLGIVSRTAAVPLLKSVTCLIAFPPTDELAIAVPPVSFAPLSLHVTGKLTVNPLPATAAAAITGYPITGVKTTVAPGARATGGWIVAVGGCGGADGGASDGSG